MVGLLNMRARGNPTPNPLFGINMSGPEFAPWNGQTFPTKADWAYCRSQGIGFARLPIAWESLQPTLGGALDSTYLTSIKTAFTDAGQVGMGVIPEIHNFGAYVDQAQWTTTVGYAGNAGTVGTGVNFIGDAVATTAHYANLFTRFIPEIVPFSNVLGTGIMNEPSQNVVRTNILTTPNYFEGADWFPTSNAVLTQQAAGTNPIAGYGPSWTITSGDGFGSVAQGVTFAAVPYVLSVYAKCAAGTEPLAIGISGTFSSEQTVTTSWQRFQFTRTPSAGLANAQFVVNAVSGHTIEIANAQLELGSTATTYAPNPWNQYAQIAINAVQAVNSSIPIYVSGGAGFSQASKWDQNNYEQYLLTGTNPRIDEAHQYFDGPQGVGGGGAYSGDFTSYSITTSTGSDCMTPFTTWLGDVSATGFLGEFGIPLSAADNNGQWLPTQVSCLNALLADGTPGAQWFYRSNGVQPGNILGITNNGDLRLTQMVAVR